jgi:hypothetical protein
MKEQNEMLTFIQESIEKKSFVKLTLSSPFEKSSTLVNVYIRQVIIKNESFFSFTYRYKTNDQTKNLSFEKGLTEIQSLILSSFKTIYLFSTSGDFALLTSKKGGCTIQKKKASFTVSPDNTHDRQKTKRVSNDKFYLRQLNITDSEGVIIPKMADKYRQINKYLEIIDGLVSSVTLPDEINIVDMGSGKGYLTFALYDFLTSEKNLNVTVTGIELRTELVDFCNDVANSCGFDKLSFICKPIEEYSEKKIDVLIALHACDTATDDAIHKGILSDAHLIICAPCCHKQIRQQVKGIEQESPLLKYGIFKERQFEMVTDTIRALIMEKNNYNTKVFEFISNEHTRKNIMLVGTKSLKKNNIDVIKEKIDHLKKSYHINFHYLETLK